MAEAPGRLGIPVERKVAHLNGLPLRIGVAALALLSVAFAADGAMLDTDRDGLSDEIEQRLLEKYRPSFLISTSDCAGMPARIKPGQVRPEVAASDGTIYGQAFPSSNNRETVEIHYYTLWSHDCGRMSHPYDVEHVAVLASVEESKERALYWYAGAHEKTVCDISSGARADAIGGEHQGAKVWSSSGKHALYLRQEMCDAGCGADSCEGPVELERNGPVVNVGERGAPMNDSLWVDSTDWVLSEKMSSDFTPAVIALLDASPEESVITVKGRSPVRGTIQGSNAVLDRASSGANQTGAALGSANEGTSSGVAKAARATGRSLKRAWKAVFSQKQTK